MIVLFQVKVVANSNAGPEGFALRPRGEEPAVPPNGESSDALAQMKREQSRGWDVTRLFDTGVQSRRGVASARGDALVKALPERAI